MLPTKLTTRIVPPFLAAVLLLTAACGSDDADDAEAAEGTDSSLTWEDCESGSECAQLEVPLDYDDTEGDQLTLGLTRVPASGDRIGALFVNPGGPGAEVDDFPAIVADGLPDEVTERFDIVALDPRGVGETNLISCGYDWADLYGVDHAIDSEEEEAALLTTSEDYVESCSSAVGTDVLEHMGTRNVARDTDLAREALGDDKISYLGYSYGSSVGQVYAELFPDRTRAMVIDGIVDLGSTGLESAGAQAQGFEQALEVFAADCNSRPSECPLAPDALTEIQALLAAVGEGPIPAEPEEIGAGDVNVALAMALYRDDLWPSLAQGVANAQAGDGTLLGQLAQEYVGLANFDVYFAVGCLDSAWPSDPQEHLAEAAAIGENAPHFGEALVNDYIRCSMWPVEADPLEAVTAPGTPPILVVSTTNDPATPYEAGVNVAQTLETGVLLTYEGNQHTVVATGVDCVDAAVADYLVDLDPPADGTTC